MRLQDGSVLVLTPGLLVDGWVQVVVPPLTTLLAYAPWQLMCDLRPLLRSNFTNQFDNSLVLLQLQALI